MGCAGSSDAAVDGHYSSAEKYKKKKEEPERFNIECYYEVVKMLGVGGSGETWLCIDNVSKKQLAVKFIKRPIPAIILPMLKYEIKIQAELGDGHVNLVSAKEVVLTPSHLAIVMEYCAGGNLTSYVTDRWDTTHERDGLFLSEDEARYFFRQYTDAVDYLHRNKVAHRDLKLDNIVLDGSTPPRIKVCDFGFAKNWSSDEAYMMTQIGTPVYMSPQLITTKEEKGKGYDAIKSDLWACGVLLFVMLLGSFPYDHTEHPDPNSSQAHAEVWLQQNQAKWSESPNVGDSVEKLSPLCRDLLDKMLERDERKRINMQEIRAHKWYKKSTGDNFEKSLWEMAEAQKKRDIRVTKGIFQTKERNQALDDLLEHSTKEATYDELNTAMFPPKRVDLTSSVALKLSSSIDMSLHGGGLKTLVEMPSFPASPEPSVHYQSEGGGAMYNSSSRGVGGGGGEAGPSNSSAQKGLVHNSSNMSLNSSSQGAVSSKGSTKLQELFSDPELLKYQQEQQQQQQQQQQGQGQGNDPGQPSTSQSARLNQGQSRLASSSSASCSTSSSAAAQQAAAVHQTVVSAFATVQMKKDKPRHYTRFSDVPEVDEDALSSRGPSLAQHYHHPEAVSAPSKKSETYLASGLDGPDSSLSD